MVFMKCLATDVKMSEPFKKKKHGLLCYCLFNEQRSIAVEILTVRDMLKSFFLPRNGPLDECT